MIVVGICIYIAITHRHVYLSIYVLQRRDGAQKEEETDPHVR